MKFTLSLTQQCNLACNYCYIDKQPQQMSATTARQIVEQIFAFTPAGVVLDIGFFGGEPLLRFNLLQEIVRQVQEHPQRQDHPVVFSVTTNGTIFTPEIAAFLAANDIIYCLSCDGPASVHDRNRRFADGRGSFATVEANIRRAREQLPRIWVNAVYQPQTLALLPEAVAYLADLQVERIYLNPDYSAPWSAADCQALAPSYAAIGDQYVRRMAAGRAQYISLIDSKLAAIIKDGYAPHECCRMGQKEFAYSASGHIYPCERLIGSGAENQHCIGHVSTGLDAVRACTPAEGSKCSSPECSSCALAPYCMNWCGCSNYFSTGRYDTVGAFLCTSEKAAITTALDVFQALEHHFGAEVFNRIIAVANPAQPPD